MQDGKGRHAGFRAWWRPRLHWAPALALCLATAAPQAMPMKWRSANFKYVVDGKPLRDVLRDFGASQAMVVAVAPDVDGSVVGKFDLTPRQFIDLLALSYGFVYYYNGAVLHVSAAQGMRSTLVRLSYARIEQLRETLDRMKVSEPRFPIVYDEAANTALVAGPQEYVDVIREIAVQLEKRTQTGGRSVTRLFPLRFAWAADRRTAGEEVLPGMASVLQALYGRNGNEGDGARERSGLSLTTSLSGDRNGSDKVAPPLGAAQPEKTVEASALTLRKAFNMDGRSTSGAAPGGSSSFSPTAMPQRPPGVDAGDGRQDEENLPVFLPDIGGNGVIVRDLPERMPAYEALIASLDIQPRMVEIAVQILDISEGALAEFGVDWTLRGRHLAARSSDGERTAPESTTGAVLTAVLGNSGRALLARIAALQEQGRARISSQPKVATLNNVTAVMSSEKTFYVKVSGYQTASLYNVSAGLDLKVTPMATLGPEGYRIRLDVQVQDGQISDTETVDTLPTVTRSQLSTQAFVRQDESLLLAGHTVEQTTHRTTGVPLLADLPVIGGAFRQKSSDTRRSERLFLVTPRVLD